MLALDLKADETRWTRTGHALLVGRFSDLSSAEIASLWELVHGFSRVTVVAVADRRDAEIVAAMVGVGCGLLIHRADSEREIFAAAERRARELVEMAPHGIVVTHLVVKSWRHLRRHVARAHYECLLVGDRALRLPDRILVRKAGWARIQPEAPGRNAVRVAA